MLKVRRSVLDRLHLAEALPPNSSVVGPEDERSSEIEELRSRNRELFALLEIRRPQQRPRSLKRSSAPP